MWCVYRTWFDWRGDSLVWFQLYTAFQVSWSEVISTKFMHYWAACLFLWFCATTGFAGYCLQSLGIVYGRAVYSHISVNKQMRRWLDALPPSPPPLTAQCAVFLLVPIDGSNYWISGTGFQIHKYFGPWFVMLFRFREFLSRYISYIILWLLHLTWAAKNHSFVSQKPGM